MKNETKHFLKNLNYTLRFKVFSSVRSKDINEVLQLLAPYQSPKQLIRFGETGDGGYLLPDDLEGIVASFSPGVSDTMDFDLEIADRGIACYLIDASIEKPVAAHPLITFDKKFLGSKTEGDFISLDDWIVQYAPPTGDLILQIDIESAEYDVFAAASQKTLERFRIILVEFHHFHKIFRGSHFSKYKIAFEKLNTLFEVVHLHPNNCASCFNIANHNIPSVFEVTYLRRDRLQTRIPNTQIPHSLDAPNDDGNPDYAMPRFWET